MPDAVARIAEQWSHERPDLDSSPILVIGRIFRVGQKLDAALRSPFVASHLGGGDFDVLAALRRSGEPFALRPRELSQSLLVTTGAISKRIDRLQRQDLVTRHRSVHDDGRGTLVELTPTGRELVDRLIATHLANEARLLAALTRSERTVLGDLLAKLEASIGP